jgi:hypothetical protein
MIKVPVFHSSEAEPQCNVSVITFVSEAVSFP